MSICCIMLRDKFTGYYESQVQLTIGISFFNLEISNLQGNLFKAIIFIDYHKGDR